MLSFCCLLRFFWGFWGFFFCRRRRCCCLIYFWKRNLMMRLRYTLHTRGRSHKYLPAEQQQQQHLKHYWTRTSEQDSQERETETEEDGKIGREKEALSVCRCFSYYLSNLSRSACCAACQCRSNMCILLEYLLWYFLFIFLVKSLQRFQWARLRFSSKRSIRNEFDIDSKF